MIDSWKFIHSRTYEIMYTYNIHKVVLSKFPWPKNYPNYV